MAQLVTCVPCKDKDLNLDLKHSWETCNPSAGEADTGRSLELTGQPGLPNLQNPGS